MVQIAELPVRFIHGKVIADGAINGRKVGVMLDSGAMNTVMPRPTAIRLELSRQKVMGYRMFGVGGEAVVELAVVDELKIGEAKVTEHRILVAGEHEFGDNVAVLLGEDFFHQVDVEFDLAHNAVRLFRPTDCDGVSLAYWAPKTASEVAMEPISDARPQVVLPVLINGKPVRAMLDSGAGASVLDKPEAVRLGVAQDATGTTSGTTTGMGPKSVNWQRVPLQSFAIGDELIKDTAIEVAEVFRDATYTPIGSNLPRQIEGTTGMLLGADFLRAHRVLIAHSQEKVYFSYVGGPVFLPTAPEPTLAQGPTNTEPKSATDFIKRGNSWRAKGDLDRAIADFDAALSVDPRSAVALVNRASARVAKADFEQAIADANRAIEIDPKLPLAYNQLAWTLATAEQPAVRDGRRAVESALKACELSEWKISAFIDTLAAANARAGDFANAVKWQKKAMEDPKRASDDKASQRLHLYEEGKAWPPD
ncbi:MAG TPA: aspartyl protease family protein [Casimicrobiaceae bacterium]|nr:aspartyl protease family protein [Casimicrobiaceae bacterium]